jgi:hypothetical protein
MTEKQIQADAIKEFVYTMIGALEGGFVDSNKPALSQIHRFAQLHVKDNYGVEMPDLSEAWGKDVADLCSARSRAIARLIRVEGSGGSKIYSGHYYTEGEADAAYLMDTGEDADRVETWEFISCEWAELKNFARRGIEST